MNKELLEKNLNELNATEVKAIAKELKIKDWWNKKKDLLITEIETLRTEYRKSLAMQKKETPGSKKTEPKKDTTPKVEELPQDENIVTLKEIIAELGVKGMKARRVLRNNEDKIQRPYKRWEWHKEKHKDIIQQVKDLLK